MNGEEDSIVAAAAEWHSRSAGDGMDWDGFTAWLEADPRHAATYDEVALADALLQEHRDTLRRNAAAAQVMPAHAVPAGEPAVVVRPVFARWTRWAGVAMAASLVAVLAIPQFIDPAPHMYATANAAQRIALDDGSSVILAPHSTLSVGGRAQDRMALNGGAWFDIRHDPDRAMTITAGDIAISDIGTRFDVQAIDGLVRVEVAEGEVNVASPALSQSVHLPHGQGLTFDGKRGTAVVTPVSAEAIGEWRNGQLNYDSMPLALVAADLGRYAGVRVVVPDALQDRRFSGTLVIGDGEAALRDLAQLMGLELGGGPGGYRLDDQR